METPSAPNRVAKRGAEDSGQYFRYMAEFVGFGEADAQLIRRSKPVVAGHLHEIVAQFYAHLLRYPPTRKFFLRDDGTVDHDYLELRMRHLTNFWLRTAEGVYDDDYARYVDYVGRAHTSHGADPKIYIAERYVIGQVGFMQHAISEVINRDLGDQDWGFAALEAWDKLMMVLLELLSRAYGDEHDAEHYESLLAVDQDAVARMAEHAYDHELGVAHRAPLKDVVVARVEEIPDGERKIVQVEGLSIGVFHHKGEWYALRNSCLHRSGPVATGCLEGDVLTCPWHGFQYNVTTGQMLVDPSAALDSYPVRLEEDSVILQIPDEPEREALARMFVEPAAKPQGMAAPAPAPSLKPNEFRLAELPPGKMRRLRVSGQEVAVYNVEGAFYATQNDCTHAEGPLSEGELEGCIVTCPWHGSQFDVTDGSVQEGPADEPLRTYRVEIEGEIGRVLAS